MVKALYGGTNIIDIRNPGMYDKFHGPEGLTRDGLECLDCEWGVHPRMLDKETPQRRPILVHSPRLGADPEKRCESLKAGNPNAGRKKLLKCLVRDHLESIGCTARLDPPRVGDRIDVEARSGKRKIAIRVELGKVSVEEAQGVDARLARLGFEVLWLTARTSWTNKTKAFGITFVDNKPDLEAIDMGEYFPVVDTGYLVQSAGRLIQPANNPIGLGKVLTEFIQGDIQHHNLRTGIHGWATPGSWDSYIRKLIGDRDDAKAELATTTDDLRHAQASRRSLDTELKAERDTLASVRAELDAETAHRKAATTWVSRVEELRDSSAMARLSLRKHPEFEHPPRQDSDPVPAGWRVLVARTWPLALATVLAIGPALFLLTVLATPTWGFWRWPAAIGASLLPLLGAWLDMRWCWAKDAGTGIRCRRRRERPWHRCSRRQHSANLFQVFALLCVLEGGVGLYWSFSTLLA